MKKLEILHTAAALIVLISSCKKETDPMINEQPVPMQNAVVVPPEPTASYKLILTGRWSMPQLTVPAGNHFTRFEGMIHSNESFIFHPGYPASLGVENVAETGNSTALLSEMNAYIAAGKALNTFSLTLSTITSTDSVIINVSTQHPFISFESMIAPSPDWFAGLDGYTLIQNGKWVTDVSINISGYDAGTEDGDIFGYNNPATNPQQNVALMTTMNASVIANGNSVVGSFATLRIIKQ